MTTITASMLQRRQSAPLDWLDSVDGPVTLRPYQRESFDAIIRELYTLGRRSTLLSSCVGSGKTSTLGMVTKYVASERSERVLVVAHRNELIEQIAERLQLLGVHAVVEKAKLCGRAQINTADRPVDAVVGSVATMKGDRLKRWSPDSFGLIIRDEAHRIHSASDLAILDHFASAKVLGVTATPYRMDGKNLGDIFESTAYSYPLRQGIIEGHLVPIKAIKANVRINLRGLKRTTSDYNVGDLEDRILPMVEFLANAVKDVIGERKTVVFAPDVRSAHAMSDALNQVGIKSASLSCKSKDRREILADFRSGAIQTIVNYDILGEGVDVPDISCVVLMRPTRSFGLLNQQVGRGVRRSDETGKVDCLVIDFDWQLDDGDPLCHVEELVATGKAGKRAAAKAAADRGDGPSDIMESMQRAEEKEEVLIRLEDRLKVLVQRRQTNLKWSAFDPVTSGCKIIGVRPPSDYEARVHKAHPNVVAALVGYGIDAKEAEGLSRRAAVEMLKWLKNRKAEGMATFKQLQMLVKSGWDRDAAVRLTKDQASITIDTIIQRRRQA